MGVADTTPAATPSATPPIITAEDNPSATELALLSRDANEEGEPSVAKGGGAEGVAAAVGGLAFGIYAALSSVPQKFL